MSAPAVDVHQHLWPEALVSALSRRPEPPCLRKDVLRLAGMPEARLDLDEHRLERRLARLDAEGTDVALVSLQPTLGLDELPAEESAPLVAAYHEGIRELVATAGGRLAALAHAEARDGFAGATVSAPRLVNALLAGREPALLGELEARGEILFVHPGPAAQPPTAPAWWSEVAAYTAQMQAAYLAWRARGPSSHPGLRVVFAILAGGAPLQLERLASRSRDAAATRPDTVFLETASYGRRALEVCLATFGVRQLVYGSDAPVIDSQPTLRALAGFGQAVTDAVRRENPSLLLG